jgi:hypothetical protein
MNVTYNNFPTDNRVLQGENGQVQPFNQMNQQRIYFMPTDTMESIYKGIIHGIWASNISKVNNTSFKKVQIGDMLFLYCSLTGGEDKENQGFHAVGIIVGKKDPNYTDNLTFGNGIYGNVVEVKWLNQPRKDRILTLSEAQDIVPYSKWRWTLQSGQYTNVTESGWDIGSGPMNKLMNRLIVGKSAREMYVEKVNGHKKIYDKMVNGRKDPKIKYPESPKVEEEKKATLTPLDAYLKKMNAEANSEYNFFPEDPVVTEKNENPPIEKIGKLTEEEQKILKKIQRPWDWYNQGRKNNNY